MHKDASGSVFDYPSIGLLHVRDLEKDLFYDSEATLKVCIDYEASTIYREYVPLSGILRASNKKVTDVVSFVGSWANKNNTLLVLTGDFGSGKTTIMERVRYEFSKGRVQGDDNLIPILLRLRTLRHYPDLWNFISANLVRNHYIEPPEQTFNSQLSAGRLLILLDGFDEVYTGANARERGFFLAKLSPLLSSPSPCVLSTRPTYFESFNQMVDSFEGSIGKMPTLDRVNISRSSLHQIMDRLNLGSRRRVGKSAFSNTLGDPPALPGRQLKFDISGGVPRLVDRRNVRACAAKVRACAQDACDSAEIRRLVGNWRQEGKERHSPDACVRRTGEISWVRPPGRVGISYRQSGRMTRSHGTTTGTWNRRPAFGTDETPGANRPL